jgi:hypothetical protein
MTWANEALVVYHGTDDESANAIVGLSSGTYPAPSIDLSLCSRHTDFGAGFYTTTNIHQARNWANLRAKELGVIDPARYAAVIELKVDREKIAEDGSALLAFVTEGASARSDYWEFIKYCRSGGADHLLTYNKIQGVYDLVFGPVSLWPQTLVIKDCDQISFHTDKALGVITSAAVADQATASDPYFIV